MELRQLEYFVASAKHLSFTKAAHECCIVQSAMSQQISALERELNVRLFERTNRGLILTQEGEVMLREARRLLDQAEMTAEIVRQAKTAYTHVLRLGCHGNLLRNTLHAALKDFREACPHTRLLLSESMYQDLLNDLKEGRIDCMIALYHRQFDNLKWAGMETICEEPVFAVLPCDHPLANRETLTMAELADSPQILFNGEDKRRLVRNMQESGMQTTVYTFTESQSSIETLVAAGYGVSYCVRSALREHPGIVYRPLTDRPVGKTVFLWRRECGEAEEIAALLSKIMMAQAE